ncbi:hypothetical protein MOW14_14640 (plasmid) [Acinetobacter indicus]|uniref:hypothetical protein n=1 Tax=Acinetobacter indicus TaxID=756892 RepID=UPI001FA7347B|nr:hypothetical protein [Acinetobacter indicus]UNW11138.1 hypothetical protein MOW14_14640 [Acinetobacter indicus]
MTADQQNNIQPAPEKQPTKRVVNPIDKAQKKIDDLKEKLKQAEKELAEQLKKTQEKNKTEIVKFLESKGLFKHPLAKWTAKAQLIEKLLDE